MSGTSMIRAAISGNIPHIRKLISEGNSIFLADLRGWTPLHHAAFEGSYETMVALLAGMSSRDKKEALSRRTHHGETPLMIACQALKINLHLVQYLLLLGADPNCSDNTGYTAVHRACSHHPENDKVAVVRLLRDMGARLDVEAAMKPYTPLDCAIFFDAQNMELIQYLLPFCVVRRETLYDAIIFKEKIVPLLLERMLIPPSSIHFFAASQEDSKQAVLPQLCRAGGNPSILFQMDDSIVYKSATVFDEVLSATSAEFFGQIVISIATISIRLEQSKHYFLEKLLQHCDKHLTPLPVSFSEILDEEIKDFILMYISDSQHEIVGKTLQDACRVECRRAFAQAKGSEWKAYNWLKNSKIVEPIKKYLLYETCPKVVKKAQKRKYRPLFIYT